MATKSNVFNTLAEKWGVPGSKRFVKVLKAMVTPEEGKYIFELWNPMTSEELAKKLNIADEYSLQTRLEALARRRVIDSRNNTYSTPRRLIPLCHQTVNMSAITDELWTDFFLKEWRDVLAQERYERRLTGQWSVHRILPALQALAASPHIRPDEILWYENLDAMLQRSEQIMFAPCVCRIQYHQCDNKENTCGHVVFKGDSAPSFERMAKVKQFTYKEALDELYAAEDAGMCHLSPNYPGLSTVCSCCDCCCRVVGPLIHCDTDYDLNDPTKSRFQASIDQELCSGCQTCVERCMFNAIEMVKTANSKKMKAQVIEKKCMGCGLCVYKCPQKAIRFDIVRSPIHIPNITFAQAMAWVPATKEEIKKAYKV